MPSFELSDSPRVLIVRLGSLGDVIHAVPALSDMRNRWPEAVIDWVAEAAYVPLLEQTAGIDRVWTADTKRWRRSPTSWTKASRLFRDLRARRYDVALDFQGLLKSALIARACGARRRVGFDASLARERQASRLYTDPLSPDPQGLHRCQLNQQFLIPLGIQPQDRVELPIAPPPDDTRYVDRRLEALDLRRPVLLNPGAGWPTKLWDIARFVELAGRIERELESPVVFTYGPEEETLIEQARLKAPEDLEIRTFPTTILQLAALCGRARLMVAGDTGPLHLAVAMGTPTVALMGPTWPWRNGPFNPADISVQVERECPNPYEKRRCPVDHFCMDQTVEQAFEAVRRRLAVE